MKILFLFYLHRKLDGLWILKSFGVLLIDKCKPFPFASAHSFLVQVLQIFSKLYVAMVEVLRLPILNLIISLCICLLLQALLSAEH